MVGDFTFWLGVEGDSGRVGYAETGSRPSDGAASSTASPPSGFDPARGDGLFYDSEGFAITIGGERYGPISPLRKAAIDAREEILSIWHEVIELHVDRAYCAISDVIGDPE